MCGESLLLPLNSASRSAPTHVTQRTTGVRFEKYLLRARGIYTIVLFGLSKTRLKLRLIENAFPSETNVLE